MKLVLLINLYLFSFLSIIQNIVNPQEDFVRFNLIMKEKRITSYSQLEVSLTFQALRKSGIVIPKIFFFGYENDERADIIFYLYRLEKKSLFKKVGTTADYDYLYDKEYSNLSYLQMTTVEFDLFHFYSTNLTNGTYRVRAKFIIPRENNYSKRYVYSKWCYFTVKDLKLPARPEE